MPIALPRPQAEPPPFSRHRRRLERADRVRRHRTALSERAGRPAADHPRVQVGDVSATPASCGARRPPRRMLVEVATPTASGIRAACSSTPCRRATSRQGVDRRLAGRTGHLLRVRFQDVASPTILGEPTVGRFRTAPSDRARLVYGRRYRRPGLGHRRARGGMRSYATMLKNRPDFFIHSGDDLCRGAIAAELKLPNGEIWKNIVTEEKSKPPRRWPSSAATTIQSFDRNLRASTPRFRCSRNGTITRSPTMVAGEPLHPGRASAQEIRRQERAGTRGARVARFSMNYMPMRESIAEPGRVYRKILWAAARRLHARHGSYRGPNGEGNQEPTARGLFSRSDPGGLAQTRTDEFTRTWKVIAADMPLSLIVVYDNDRKWGVEAIAQGDGPPRGASRDRGHPVLHQTCGRPQHALAHRRRALLRGAPLRSGRTQFQELRAVLGVRHRPIHAGAFGPTTSDNTFGRRSCSRRAPQGAAVRPARRL